MPQKSAAQRDFNIAISAPQNTQEAQDIRTGLEKAFEDLGITGNIRLINEKCQKEEDALNAAYASLQKTDFVIGGFCSASTKETAKEYAKADIPFFVLGITDPTLTLKDYPNMIRLLPKAEKLYPSFIRELTTYVADKKFLILDDMTPQSDSLVRLLKKSLPAKNIKIVNLPTNQAKKNIKKLKQQNDFKQDFIIVTSSISSQAVRMVSRVRESGLKTPIIGLNSLGSFEFNRMLGAMKSNIFVYLSERKHYQFDALMLVAEMRFHGKNVSELTVGSYTAVQIYLQALLNKNKNDGNLIFHNKTFQTVLGNITFDGLGDIKNLFKGQFYVWRQDKVFPITQPIDKQ